MEMDHPNPPPAPQAEDHHQVHQCKLTQKETDVADVVDHGLLDKASQVKSSDTSDLKTEPDLQDHTPAQSQSPTCEQMPLVVEPDTNDDVLGNKVKFVCPLILKTYSMVSKSESSTDVVHEEPQQSSVSTAMGTAYSPSSSDGAMAPHQVRQAEMTNNLHLKLKLTSPDWKLARPCAVHLMDVLTVPGIGPGQDTDVDRLHGPGWKTRRTLPKHLRPHQGVHTGRRPCCFTRSEDGVWRLRRVAGHSCQGYVCTVCGKRFERRKTLRRHRRFHTGEKPYSCPLCPKTFALSKSLRRHQRFHTGERPHQCNQCGKSFRLRENLRAHMRLHLGEKPFSCTKCGKAFRIIKNLVKHNLSQCGFFIPSFKTLAGV